MFLYFWETKGTSGRGAEKEGDRGSEAGSELSAQSSTWGLNSTNREIMIWAQDRRLADWVTQALLPPLLEAPGAAISGDFWTFYDI